jgi:hypothetical protein
MVRVRVRVGVWSRVSVSKTVFLLRFATLEASEITSSTKCQEAK